MLQTADRLAPQASSSEELYLLAVIRSNVFAFRIDTTRACNTLKTVLPKLDETYRGKAQERMTDVYSCAP